MKLSSNFYNNPKGASQTVTVKEAREILLETDGWIFAQGAAYDLHIQHLGAGVKRITAKLKPL